MEAKYIWCTERIENGVDLLLIRLEKIDNDFYESLIKFISDHGYSPKVVVRNTDILSFHGLEIISSKHQVLLHDKEIKMTKKEFYILEPMLTT